MGNENKNEYSTARIEKKVKEIKRKKSEILKCMKERKRKMMNRMNINKLEKKHANMFFVRQAHALHLDFCIVNVSNATIHVYKTMVADANKRTYTCRGIHDTRIHTHRHILLFY